VYANFKKNIANDRNDQMKCDVILESYHLHESDLSPYFIISDLGQSRL